MANYQYDEGGNMAAYFILTFLTLILVPTTYTVLPSSKKGKAEIESCQCTPCMDQRDRVRRREKRSLLHPQLGFKALFLLFGWTAFAFVSYKAATARLDNKIYDPFEILGIRSGTTEKEIKSHYKKLSRKFHPDKVKLAVNQTIEEVEAYFVDLTKAYKSLTDETIRKNLENFGHPDGRQEVSMGIAIPKWVIEGKNKFWVLLAYTAAIGGVLPVIISRWWFGSRSRTKDGVATSTAELFFKTIKEDSNIRDILGCLKGAYQKEYGVSVPLPDLEETVRKRAGTNEDIGSRQMTLLYAHLLRIPIEDAKLKREQDEALLRTPALMSSLLNIAMSHNWSAPVLSSLRLQAYLAQAVLPTNTRYSSVVQLPNITETDAVEAVEGVEPNFENVLEYLNDKQDARLDDVKKAMAKWGRLELVEASFKVIGERIVTPQSIVQLLIKVRLSPPIRDEGETSGQNDKSKDNEKKDLTFLSSRRDSEEMPNGLKVLGQAHAPFWPTTRKPSWWVVIVDYKTSRLVIPPFKISDVPFSDPTKERNYRAYKSQFQGPQQVASYPWKILIIGDTFIGDEVSRALTLKVEDVSQLTVDEQGVDDEISEPEEDSLAGQMAMMRGSSVKKSPVHGDDDEDDDDDSSTDDEKGSSGSSSDSD